MCVCVRARVRAYASVCQLVGKTGDRLKVLISIIDAYTGFAGTVLCQPFQ